MAWYTVSIYSSTNKTNEKKLADYEIIINSKVSHETLFNEGTLECFNLVLQNEYNIERDKKSSFENRAIGLMAFVMACLTLFITHIIEGGWDKYLQKPFNSCLLFKIVGILFVVITSLIIFYNIYSIIQIKVLENTRIDKLLNENNMKQSKQKTLISLNEMYYNMIKERRVDNMKNANKLKNSIIATICFIIGIFLSLLM